MIAHLLAHFLHGRLYACHWTHRFCFREHINLTWVPKDKPWVKPTP